MIFRQFLLPDREERRRFPLMIVVKTDWCRYCVTVGLKNLSWDNAMMKFMQHQDHEREKNLTFGKLLIKLLVIMNRDPSWREWSFPTLGLGRSLIVKQEKWSNGCYFCPNNGFLSFFYPSFPRFYSLYSDCNHESWEGWWWSIRVPLPEIKLVNLSHQAHFSLT